MQQTSSVSASAIAETAMDAFAIVGERRFSHVTDRLMALTGHEDSTLVDERVMSIIAPDDHDRVERVVLGLAAGDRWRGRVRVLDSSGESTPLECSARRIDSGTLVLALRQAGDGEIDEETLTDLERYETIIESVEDGIYVLDADLRFSYVNDALCDIADLSRDDLIGMPVRDLFTVDGEYESATEQRESLIENDATTGRLMATYPTSAGERILESRYRFQPNPDGEFAGSVGVIRDVTARERRERDLARQRDELATIDQINGLMMAVMTDIVEDATQQEIEQMVCDRLAESDLVIAAWTADPILEDSPRATAGEMPTAGTSVPDDHPAPRAIRTETVQQDVPDGVESSTVAIPLLHEGVVHGVLTLHLPRSTAVSDRERDAFSVLGEAVGFAITAGKRRNLLHAETMTELELQITDPSSILAGLARDHECRLAVRDHVFAYDRWVLYVDVTSAPVESIVEDALGDARVERIRRIRSSDGLSRLEIVPAAESLFDRLSAAGVEVVSLEFDQGVGTLVIEVPDGTAVREVVDLIDTVVASTSVLARRPNESPDVRNTARLIDDLTDRQQEVLETALRAGYYTRPRASTGEEIAETLEVTPQTLHAHLRKAERAIIGGLFGS